MFVFFEDRVIESDFNPILNIQMITSPSIYCITFICYLRLFITKYICMNMVQNGFVSWL